MENAGYKRVKDREEEQTRIAAYNRFKDRKKERARMSAVYRQDPEEICREYDSNGALSGYADGKRPGSSDDDKELIKLVETHLSDVYEQYDPKDIRYTIDRLYREKITSINTPDGVITKTVGDWEIWAVNDFWKSVSDYSDYKMQTQSPKGQEKLRQHLVSIKTAIGEQTKPAWVWEKELDDKLRGEKIVTIQIASGSTAPKAPIKLWEEDAKNVFWRSVQCTDPTSWRRAMEIFSHGFPWRPPSSWHID